MPATETFRRTIAQSGFTLDSHFRTWFGCKGELTIEDIRKMYAGTQRAMKFGYLTPTVKVGHWDIQQESRGYVKGINLVPVTQKSGKKGLGIEAEFILQPEVAKEYKAGKYPQVSIENDDNGMYTDDAGRSFGDVITAFALLGTEQPAVTGMDPYNGTNETEENVEGKSMKSVQTRSTVTDGALLGALKRLFNSNSKGKSMKNKATLPTSIIEGVTALCEEIKMKAEAIRDGGDDYDPSADIESIIGNSDAIMEQIASDYEEDTSEASTDTADKGDGEKSMAKAVAKALKPLEEQLKALTKANAALKSSAEADAKKAAKIETDAIFNDLVSKGAACAGDRDMFDIIAGAKGATTARDHYLAHVRRDMPAGNKLSTDASDHTEAGIRAKMDNHYKSVMGITDEKIRANMVEKHIERIKAQGAA